MKINIISAWKWLTLNMVLLLFFLQKHHHHNKLSRPCIKIFEWCVCVFHLVVQMTWLWSAWYEHKYLASSPPPPPKQKHTCCSFHKMHVKHTIFIFLEFFKTFCMSCNEGKGVGGILESLCLCPCEWTLSRLYLLNHIAFSCNQTLYNGVSSWVRV